MKVLMDRRALEILSSRNGRAGVVVVDLIRLIKTSLAIAIALAAATV
jgi:hypothetical protein